MGKKLHFPQPSEQRIDPFPHANSKIILTMILLVNFMRGFGTNVVSIGLPNHILILGGTLASYGLILGIFQIFQAIFQIPTSLLSDKFGRRKLILIGLLVYIIGTILCGFSSSIPQLIISRIIQGGGAFSSVIMSIIGDITKGEAKKRAISLYFFSLTAGYFFGTFFGGWFTDLIGVEGIFFLCAGLTLFSFLILLIFLPDTAPVKMEVHLNDEKRIKRKSSISQLSWREKTQFLRLKGYYGGTLAMVLKTGIMSGLTAYSIWVLSIFYNFSNVNLSLVMIPILIFYILGLLLSPKLSKKIGSARLISFSFILNAVLFGLIIFIPMLGIYLTLSIVAFFIFGLLDPTITTFTLDFVPAPSRGLGTGVFQTFLFLASALGQIFLLKLSNLTNFQITYLVSAGLCMLAWLIIEILKRDKK